MLGRLLRSTTASLVLGLAAVAQSGERRAAPIPPERQILWQRSLEDALALAQKEHRPLLVAVNMDGESASERIVRERYRDPAFVAMTRSFVCVVASAFRHSARDHDDQGRRIPCPRLGGVTCGEHIALEPVLFDTYLGGERIAPRHAVILRDGTKTFDLSLLFDFRDLDKKIAEAAKLAPPAGPIEPLPWLAGPPAHAAAWTALASARTNRVRTAFEAALQVVDEPSAMAALDEIAAKGDAGSIEALRILFSRRPAPSSGLLDRIQTTAKALRLDLGSPIWAKLGGLGRWPGAPGLGDDAALLRFLGKPERAALISYAALGAETDSKLALAALESTCTPAEMEKVHAALRDFGVRPDVEAWWRKQVDLGPQSGSPKAAEPPKSLDTLESELSDLEHRLGDSLDAASRDSEALAQYGRALLALAQRRSETGGSGVDLLLKDAAQFLGRAYDAGKHDAKLLFDRAKTAYFSGDYAREERFALEGEALASGADRVEAERWVGDASARLIGARYLADPATTIGGILRGGRALMEVASSGSADETDWISLGTFLSAAGLHRESAAVLQLAAERLPASAVVRQAWNQELALGGRVDLAPAKAEWIAARLPRSAESAWFAGHARLLAGEDARREEEPDVAVAHYEKAEIWFARSVEMRPEFRASTDPYRAAAALGRGFAHLLADRRAEAAKAFVDAVAIRVPIDGVRDGLDREPVDLLDGALEWRESGPSPVDVPSLLDDLERSAPGDATWIRAVSDSELREALRADGRGEIVEGDRYLRVAIDAARRAVGIASDEETKRALAQPLAILAERTLARGDFAGARQPLAEAAALLDEPPVAEDADAQAVQAAAARLRDLLGDARPRFRPGR